MTRQTKKRKLALEILKGAREKISRKNGWTKDRYESPAGGYCILGAVAVTSVELGVAMSAESHGLVISALGRESLMTEMFDGVDVVTLNDYARSKKPVLAFLDERIAALEAK